MSSFSVLMAHMAAAMLPPDVPETTFSLEYTPASMRLRMEPRWYIVIEPPPESMSAEVPRVWRYRRRDGRSDFVAVESREQTDVVRSSIWLRSAGPGWASPTARSLQDSAYTSSEPRGLRSKRGARAGEERGGEVERWEMCWEMRGEVDEPSLSREEEDLDRERGEEGGEEPPEPEPEPEREPKRQVSALVVVTTKLPIHPLSHRLSPSPGSSPSIAPVPFASSFPLPPA
mmetsp:Transcript_7176/g.14115  ORF Transcript_7176/g.14115 Transcript_7176/m.14115 type:complete len:230 (-) Transcript_7176:57-746(-)